jgi:predicted nucleic acid-binding protein
MTHLLDSSAFFAFFFNERGRERVESLIGDPAAQVGLSVVTSVELWARLKAEGRAEVFDQEWAEHQPLFDRVIPIDLEVCQLAIKLRGCATDRLPTIDSLIAATAAAHNAVLVHRDPHFRAIPAEMLKQEFLG